MRMFIKKRILKGLRRRQPQMSCWCKHYRELSMWGVVKWGENGARKKKKAEREAKKIWMERRCHWTSPPAKGMFSNVWPSMLPHLILFRDTRLAEKKFNEENPIFEKNLRKSRRNIHPKSSSSIISGSVVGVKIVSSFASLLRGEKKKK